MYISYRMAMHRGIGLFYKILKKVLNHNKMRVSAEFIEKHKITINQWFQYKNYKNANL